MPGLLDIGDLDELIDTEATPHESISDRIDIPDFIQTSIEPSTPSQSDLVKQAIMKRTAVDPEMAMYEKGQQDLRAFREAKRGADAISNFGNAFSSFSQGVNAPKQNNSLYDNFTKQSSDLLKSNEEDLDRRQKIVTAISGRKIAANAREASRNNLHNYQDNRMNLQRNRLIGGLESELRKDQLAQTSELNMASLAKSEALLNRTDVPLTPQMLSDAEQDIASALTLRGQGATEGKIQRSELVTMQRKLADLRQKWGNQIVDLRKEAPELVNQIKLVNQALKEDYRDTISQRKHSILDDKMAIWGDDPILARKMDGLRASISKRYGTPKMVDVARGHKSPPQMHQSPGEASGGFINSANAGEVRAVVKKQYSPSRNQTKIIYSDGTEEILDGKH